MGWIGVKKHTNNAAIEAWCDEMGIKNYTINSRGEIDVDGDVHLNYRDFKELPYKFGKINGYFSLDDCKNLISLKNCPNEVCSAFDVDDCFQLNSLEGCPKKIKGDFWCMCCQREFTEEEIRSLCQIGGCVYL